jgi:hypothetical protein
MSPLRKGCYRSHQRNPIGRRDVFTYPEYRNSGVMTFIVNQSGVVTKRTLVRKRQTWLAP